MSDEDIVYRQKLTKEGYRVVYFPKYIKPVFGAYAYDGMCLIEVSSFKGFKDFYDRLTIFLNQLTQKI